MSAPQFSLDNRLAQCADFIPNGATVADIGTDHAYLPVWLTTTGKIKHAIAADINQLPLNRGKNTIAKYGAKEMVETRLSNGLLNITPNEVSHIVIAGMGGELIANIIDAAPWVKTKHKTLILQPMTRAFILRQYLYNNGFSITKEKAVEAEGRVYTVIEAVFTDKEQTPTMAQLFIGQLNPAKFDLDRKYVEKQIHSLEVKADGLKNSDETAAQNVLDLIEQLKENLQ